MSLLHPRSVVLVRGLLPRAKCESKSWALSAAATNRKTKISPAPREFLSPTYFSHGLSNRYPPTPWPSGVGDGHPKPTRALRLQQPERKLIQVRAAGEGAPRDDAATGPARRSPLLPGFRRQTRPPVPKPSVAAKPAPADSCRAPPRSPAATECRAGASASGSWNAAPAYS